MIGGLHVLIYFYLYNSLRQDLAGSTLTQGFFSFLSKPLLENENNFDSKLITSIKDILDQRNIKIFSNGFNNINNVKNIDLILKISGIWSDKNNKGVTFKFMLP